MTADELTRRAAAPPAGISRLDGGSAQRWDSAELFKGATEIEIVHERAVYRLKITRQGKLILNK